MTRRLARRLRQNDDYRFAVEWCREHGFACKAVTTGRLSHPKLRIWPDDDDAYFDVTIGSSSGICPRGVVVGHLRRGLSRFRERVNS